MQYQLHNLKASMSDIARKIGPCHLRAERLGTKEVVAELACWNWQEALL